MTAKTRKEQARRLIQARKNKGFQTPSDLVAALNEAGHNWKLSRITNYEYGLRGIGSHAAIILGRMLQISPAWLMCVDEETAQSPDEKALLAKYRMADSRGKRSIQSVADAQSEHDPGAPNQKAL